MSSFSDKLYKWYKIWLSLDRTYFNISKELHKNKPKQHVNNSYYDNLTDFSISLSAYILNCINEYNIRTNKLIDTDLIDILINPNENCKKQFINEINNKQFVLSNNDNTIDIVNTFLRHLEQNYNWFKNYDDEKYNVLISRGIIYYGLYYIIIDDKIKTLIRNNYNINAIVILHIAYSCINIGPDDYKSPYEWCIPNKYKSNILNHAYGANTLIYGFGTTFDNKNLLSKYKNIYFAPFLIDRYFGSFGSFFYINNIYSQKIDKRSLKFIIDKVWLIHPPATEYILYEAALSTIKNIKYFIFIMPVWRDSSAYNLLKNSKICYERFLKLDKYNCIVFTSNTIRSNK